MRLNLTLATLYLIDRTIAGLQARRATIKAGLIEKYRATIRRTRCYELFIAYTPAFERPAHRVGPSWRVQVRKRRD